AGASLVLIDFRVTDKADIAWVVKEVTVSLTLASGESYLGRVIPKPDMASVFEAKRELTQFNPLLGIKDQLAPHQTTDRTVAARFEQTESAIDARRNLTLHIDEIDGASFEIAEKKQ